MTRGPRRRVGEFSELRHAILVITRYGVPSQCEYPESRVQRHVVSEVRVGSALLGRSPCTKTTTPRVNTPVVRV
eukprot:3990228-Prymnesium_polylepis.1